jgi:hypothetical protein
MSVAGDAVVLDVFAGDLPGRVRDDRVGSQ